MEAESGSWGPQVLGPKHTIFLSHSGREKPFVEQLCVDLERVNHRPFFDQNRDSLPIGEEFPHYIFEAAEKCQVAVIVLSEGFLTSKWPMKELTAFVEAIKDKVNPTLRLLPLFYKLSHSDLEDDYNKERWVEKWEHLVSDHDNIDKWSFSLKELLKFNGLRFELHGNYSEVKYRGDVVEAIWEFLAPPLPSYTSEIQGCERLCEEISSMFVKGQTKDNQESCEYLGLYGMGGLGKTTLCRAMCNHYQKRFRGWVILVELDRQVGPQERLTRLRNAIQPLRLLKNSSEIISELQGHQLLKDRLRHQPPIFLVVDNVGDAEDSREEAKSYVNAGFASGSMVLVTSRSEEILKNVLFQKSEYCRPIPGLEETEAMQLFLSKAMHSGSSHSFHNPDDKLIVQNCLRHCLFGDSQFHPLALIKLGLFLYDKGASCISSWEHDLEDGDKFQISRYSDDLFRILGLGYEELKPSCKRTFLDLAFFDDIMSYRTGVYSKSNWNECDFEHKVSFLGTLNGTKTTHARTEVKHLQRLGFLNESGSGISMHDLYKEYAKWLITNGREEKEWYRICKEDSSHGAIFLPASGLLRVSLRGIPLVGPTPRKKLQEWRSVTLLHLVALKGLPILDLQGLDCLRVLKVVECNDIEGIVRTCDLLDRGFACYNDQVPRGCMHDLEIVQLESMRRLKATPFLLHCRNLQTVWSYNCPGLTYLSFCSKLKTVKLPLAGIVDKLQELGLNQALQAIYISEQSTRFLTISKRVGLLQDVVKLTNLKALDLCQDLSQDFFCEHRFSDCGGIPLVARSLDVNTLVKLCYLFLSLASMIQKILRLLQDVVSLTNLKSLDPCQDLSQDLYRDQRFSACKWIPEVARSLNVGKLVNLCYLNLSFASTIRKVEGLEKLPQLTSLALYSCYELRKLPDLTHLKKLQRLCICRCRKLDYLTVPAGVSVFHDKSADHHCLPPIQPRCPIYISHSGDEKSFVEELCVDLKRENLYAFFDENSDSSPIGEEFPWIINLGAARQCQVVVIVLSEKYLTSWWLMEELSAFLEVNKVEKANLRLVPLYLKLSNHDLKLSQKRHRWMRIWKNSVSELDDIKKWTSSLEELLKFNRVLDFELYGNLEVKYRGDVVEAIWELWSPPLLFETPAICGRQRLCEEVSSMFLKGQTKDNQESCEYLGLYGVGGMGKTTLCKAMCNHYQKRFHGWVILVELDCQAGPQERLTRLRNAIQRLGLLKNSSEIISEIQGHQLLKDRLRHQPPIFLVVDNVGDAEDSREEAKSYVNAGFASGSKVLVTSRSKTILKDVLFQKSEYCRPIPGLEETEAMQLFLSKAIHSESHNPIDELILWKRLRQCMFGDSQFHPLALRVFGTHSYNINNTNFI